ncbi:MAG TPA: hypothetical protein VME92_02535 [Acetobacteraceae bacterium]|nr:hypothetical protein [Acetobacteraceae bacterium]
MRRLFAAILLAAGVGTFTAPAARAKTPQGNDPSLPQIWLIAVGPEWRQARGWEPNDYMDLFSSQQAWSGALTHVQVFGISKRSVMTAPDQELAAIIAGLRRDHVALAMQVTPLIASRKCGLGVEGHGPRSDMLTAARRISGLGGTVQYAFMDEPLWYGHDYNARRGRAGVPCHSSIAEVAQETAAKVADIRSVFPGVKVGDVEPVGVSPPNGEDWGSQLAEWVRAYQTATGEPLGFLHVDCVWFRPNWQPQLEQAAQVARAAGIPLGIIYNASPREADNVSWTATAVSHFRYIEGQLRIVPQQAIFQTWTYFPTRVLPPSQPGTLSYVVAQYLAWRGL